MYAQTPDVVTYSKFHRNPFRGFGTPRGDRNLPIPITLAIGFYNSLYYRVNCVLINNLMLLSNVSVDRRPADRLLVAITRYLLPRRCSTSSR